MVVVPLPVAIDRRFEALIFDWDGTAIARRADDATELRTIIETLSTAAMELAIITGTSIDNVDAQLRAHPAGPGTLLVACNRGSELYRIGVGGPELLERRVATPDEDAALDAAAAATRDALAARGLSTEIVSARLNRRKIDLIPPEPWRDPPKAEIAALLDAVRARLAACAVGTLSAAVDIAATCATEAGLVDARITSDAKHIEIGLTDKGDSVRAIGRRWWNAGIGSGLVLALGDEFGPLGAVPGSDAHMLAIGDRVTAVSVGVEPEGLPSGVVACPGGPVRFLELLRDQGLRRDAGALPTIDRAPGWHLAFEHHDPDQRRADEARAALGDGTIGVRGVPLHSPASGIAPVLVAGAFTGTGPDTALLPAPAFGPSGDLPTPPSTLTIDLRTGVVQEDRDAHDEAGIRFLAPDFPATLVLRDRAEERSVIDPDRGVQPEDTIASTHADATTVSAMGTVAEHPQSGTTDRMIACGIEPPDVLRARAHAARAVGFDTLLAHRRAASAARWDACDVTCSDDAELQTAIRFALFHLMSCAADVGETGVAARGLTGPAYRGHVFWDADVFVLPFLAATHPPAARSMLEYRLRRLPAALEAATASGLRGARFPWESAGDGHDVTPTSAQDRAGHAIAIRTGLLEQHVVADVAWAARHYLDWTGDDEFARHGAHELFVQTARFWESRIRRDAHGRGHLYGVIGPDEYHEPVDDNAFTNVMARENLRWAAESAEAFPSSIAGPGDAQRWRLLADELADGYDPTTGLYEQFSGFFDLEPLVIAEVAPRRPIAADLLLGRERVAGAQVIKQADVLMMFHLLPHAVAGHALQANLRFYEPRTAHGSSLSPGVHAALCSRVGDSTRALELLRLAASIDLDDVTDTTALGLHLGAMGSVWQACVFGLLGCRPAATSLHIAPRVPPELGELGATVQFRGTRITITASTDRMVVASDGPVAVTVSGEVVALPGGSARWTRRHRHWERDL